VPITQDCVVTLDYTLADAGSGQRLDSGSTAYLHSGHGNLFPKVEAALAGREVGDAIAVELSVADAFGARDEALARTIPRSEFPPGVKVGGQLQGAGPHGPMHYRVVKIKGPVVHLDGNHPLAGRALRFAATIRQVRAASAEEIAHGHVHGAHGHHH